MSSSRKHNMLEAFQASAKEAQGEHTPHSTGGAGGPFAEESRETKRTPRPESIPEREFFEGEVPSLAQAIARLPLGPIAGGALLLLVIVFWLGFLAGGVSTVEASNGKNTGGSSELSQRGGADTGDGAVAAAVEGARTPYDNNFFALWEEGVTLRVAAYDQSDRSKDLAWEAYDYLLDQGVPVVTPLEMSKTIFLFVGAARSISELQQLEQRVEKLAGPRGKQPFAEAYPVNIKDYVQR